MNDKFYVSLEAEELLLEKGYHIEKGTQIYNERGDVIGCCPADRPTKAEAIDWLESKGVIIELSVTDDLCHWVFSIYMKGGEDILTNTDFDFESFPTRLEAEEVAIIKALELL